MSRTIINVRESQNQDSNTTRIEFSLSEPRNLPKATVGYALPCSPDAEPFTSLDAGSLTPDTVKQAGSHLLDALLRHPAVSQAINAALMTSDPGGHALYMEMDSDAADLLPWEALFSVDRDCFLGLDARWPIARILDISEQPPRTEGGFEPPLRIAAVLAAANTSPTGLTISAQQEWQALYQAVSTAGFDVEMKVFVCEEDLKKQIENLGQVNYEVSLLTSAEDIEKAVAEFRPHILHFFCHGSASPSPHLELATRADWVAGKPGKIRLEPRDLQKMPGLAGVAWLITLNCCEGANSRDARSLARALMGGGFPAVVGMRESVTTDDANVFCSAFYSSLFAQIQRYVQAEFPPTDIEWAQALYEPRRQLCEKHRDRNTQTRSSAAVQLKEWTLPILYTLREPFRIRPLCYRPGLTPEQINQLKGEINAYKTVRGSIARNPGTPPAVIEEIIETIRQRKSELYAD